MAVALSPRSSINQQNWITPKMQLEQLGPRILALTLSIAQKVTEASKFLPQMSELVAEYANSSSSLTDWYRSLESIELLPKLMPPLPDKLLEVCQSLGIPCTFVLVPENLGTTNQFVDHAKLYDKCLTFKCPWTEEIQTYGNIPAEPTHWLVHTDGVLEGSRGMTPEQQEALVASLNAEGGEWQIPNFRDETTATFLTKAATGVSLYQDVNTKGQIIETYTRVTIPGSEKYLIVGSFSQKGLDVHKNIFDCDYNYNHSAFNGYRGYGYGKVGVAVCWKFPSSSNG